jgi:ABC-2 type transport system ATP-binding protein
VIRTAGLSKVYDGTVGLDGVHLDVPAGAVYGLVGPNGAGKTTLLSVLAGLRSPSSGSVEIDADRSAIAMLPDAPAWEPWLTGREVVDLSRSLAAAGIPSDAVDRALEDAGLADAADRRVGGYSRGMLQRLGLAATVVSQPAVLLLDEPASALDPSGRREVLDLVRRLRARATVVFSSHILADVQEVSDHIGILDEGRLVFQGPVGELLAAGSAPAVLVRVRERSRDLAAALRAIDWVDSAEPLDDRVVRVRVADAARAEHDLIAALAETGIPITSVNPDTPTLEDVFLEVTG